MKLPRWIRRLFQSTRGRIILLLREKPRTVAELAKATDLTDNAVRAQLATLERDGLVHQSGESAGFRKPHFSYELTVEADDLFPKAYGQILNEVISVLKDRTGDKETESLLREVGRRVAPKHLSAEASFEDRLQRAMSILSDLGAQASMTRRGGLILICGAGCPIAAATAEHGEGCMMVETLLSEVIGSSVRQKCERTLSPRCCFEVQPAP
jgi:predicted ArsR family transcriptional regulator